MISAKRITADDYLTKPMLMKRYKNGELILTSIAIVLILITLTASALVTLFFNSFGFFEPAITLLSEYSAFLSEALDHKSNLLPYIIDSFINSSNSLESIKGNLILPFYLAGNLLNIIITTICVSTIFGTLKTGLEKLKEAGTSLHNAEPLK